MKYIKLVGTTKCAQVDDDLFDYLNQFTWYLWDCNGSNYAVTIINNKSTYMHQLVLTESKLIDHKDNDGLNNQKLNLRNSSYRQNRANSKIQKNNTSGYKGVSWNKASSAWKADIKYKGKKIYLGLYDNKISAAKAYNEAAIKYFKEFANLNIIKENNNSIN